MTVEIDKNSGFCFGVVRAIKVAEKELSLSNSLYCLGDIIHNHEEVMRLVGLGLKTISHEEFKLLKNTKVLIRAHGEPPETYRIAKENGIELIDATCPVVLKLQNEIKKNYLNKKFSAADGQILIFGKKGHAEVIGLLGQTSQKGIVISSLKDISKIDFNKPSKLYSQTTQNLEEFNRIKQAIQNEYLKKGKEDLFESFNTICRHVINRTKEIEMFASTYDKIIFVSGEKSSNGLYLFELCKKANRNSYFLYKIDQLNQISFSKNETIGVCGATSTPIWLIEHIANKIQEE